jgi:hypothetical protein
MNLFLGSGVQRLSVIAPTKLTTPQCICSHLSFLDLDSSRLQRLYCRQQTQLARPSTSPLVVGPGEPATWRLSCLASPSEQWWNEWWKVCYQYFSSYCKCNRNTPFSWVWLASRDSTRTSCQGGPDVLPLATQGQSLLSEEDTAAWPDLHTWLQHSVTTVWWYAAVACHYMNRQGWSIIEWCILYK